MNEIKMHKHYEDNSTKKIFRSTCVKCNYYHNCRSKYPSQLCKCFLLKADNVGELLHCEFHGLRFHNFHKIERMSALLSHKLVTLKNRYICIRGF